MGSHMRPAAKLGAVLSRVHAHGASAMGILFPGRPRALFLDFREVSGDLYRRQVEHVRRMFPCHRLSDADGLIHAFSHQGQRLSRSADFDRARRCVQSRPLCPARFIFSFQISNPIAA